MATVTGPRFPLSHIRSYTPTPTSPRHSTSISCFSHSPDADKLELFERRLSLLYPRTFSLFVLFYAIASEHTVLGPHITFLIIVDLWPDHVLTDQHT
jgi:hypothetical protein